MDDFRDVPALRKLFGLTQSRLQPRDLSRRVMNDPGTGGYIAAYTKFLRGGIDALEDTYDGGRLAASFDIEENLLLFHTSRAKSTKDRWCSILASCIEVYGWDGFYGPRMVSGSGVLLYLLEDVAVVQSTVAEVLPHFVELCQQLRITQNPHFRVAVIVAELLSHAEADPVPLCDELENLQRSFEDPFHEQDGEWVPNPWHCKDPRWGPLKGGRNDKARWTTLMRQRFPENPRTATLRAAFLGD